MRKLATFCFAFAAGVFAAQYLLPEWLLLYGRHYRTKTLCKFASALSVQPTAMQSPITVNTVTAFLMHGKHTQKIGEKGWKIRSL